MVVIFYFNNYLSEVGRENSLSGFFVVLSRFYFYTNIFPRVRQRGRQHVGAGGEPRLQGQDRRVQQEEGGQFIE